MYRADSVFTATTRAAQHKERNRFRRTIHLPRPLENTYVLNLVGEAGQAEVHDAHFAAPIEHDVGGLPRWSRGLLWSPSGIPCPRGGCAVDWYPTMAIEVRDGIEGKVCVRCGIWKPLSYFGPNLLLGSAEGWRRRQCQACLSRGVPKASPDSGASR